jgi:hypothetical protein
MMPERGAAYKCRRDLRQECSTIFGCSADVSENLKKYVLFFRFLDRSK